MDGKPLLTHVAEHGAARHVLELALQQALGPPGGPLPGTRLSLAAYVAAVAALGPRKTYLMA